ncbi:MAG: type I methionyl aminopeptidase [Acidobacteriota bacterium]|nr:type I methionyl aminopeptidase [Acidobacteriota bacterium]
MVSHRKTEAQIEKMRRSGLIVWEAHQAAKALIEPGVTTAQIDAAVEGVILGHGAVPLFKGVPGKVPFPASTCISINEEVVHGIPGPRRLKEGDVVSVDIGVKLDGWCGDAAITHPVGTIDPQARLLLEVTEGALRVAIRGIHPKKRWSQVARDMEKYVKAAGLFVIEELVGHGIGQEMWERPQVPNYATVTTSDFKLHPGMVLAVEPMVGVGTKKVRLMPDHWTYVTTDRSAAAHFEHTIAITEQGARVLTCGPNGEGWAL